MTKNKKDKSSSSPDLNKSGAPKVCSAPSKVEVCINQLLQHTRAIFPQEDDTSQYNQQKRDNSQYNQKKINHVVFCGSQKHKKHVKTTKSHSPLFII